MERIFQKLQRAEALAQLDQEALLDSLTPFLSELNAIHPFREGNGRTQLAFLGLIGNASGHHFHFEKLIRDTYLPAVIDSYFGKLQPLRDELRKLLT